jgi:hypothetical protein
MNYRHGYHAGNFADVLKHLALGELLRLLTVKDKKLFVLDTHAGAGGYDLAGELARRTHEAEAGVLRLMALPRAGMPAAVERYLAAVAAYDRKFGPAAGGLRRYPARRGWCARRCGRATASSPASCIRPTRWRSSASSPAIARRGAPGRRLPRAEGDAAAGRAARPGADRSAVRGGGRVCQAAARAPPGAAPLCHRLLRDLVSDQGRGGGRRVRLPRWPA